MKQILAALCMLLAMTPALAEALFYVNPHGGRYLHAEKTCSAIAEEYWDGMQALSKSEALGSSALGFCPNCCEAEESFSRVISGSGADVLYEIVSFPDGRMLATGYTGSSDGWLSDRSKTSRSGWAACITADGWRAWNFCSRHSNNDRMMAPVAHEDGSVTLLLRSDGSEYNQIELLRLDPDGNVMIRKTLMKLSQEEAHCALEWPLVFGGGVVISRIEHDGPRKPVYMWYNFDGDVVRAIEGPREGSLMAVGERHAIEPHDGSYWLCLLDEQGRDTRLCELPAVGRGKDWYAAIVSLEGGAVACGWSGAEEACEGLITRFDAQGNVAEELSIPGVRLEHVLAADGGYIAAGRDRNDASSILLIDDCGEVKQRIPMEGYVAQYGHPIELLPDGRLAVVSHFTGEDTGTGYVNHEAKLTVLDVQ